MSQLVKLVILLGKALLEGQLSFGIYVWLNSSFQHEISLSFFFLFEQTEST